MKLLLPILFVALAATGLAGCATHLPGHAAKDIPPIEPQRTFRVGDRQAEQAAGQPAPPARRPAVPGGTRR